MTTGDATHHSHQDCQRTQSNRHVHVLDQDAERNQNRQRKQDTDPDFSRQSTALRRSAIGRLEEL